MFKKTIWRLSLGILSLLPWNKLFSQTNFNFNCAKDTTLTGCVSACYTFNSIIPDLRVSSSSYIVNPLSTVPACFPVYIQPNGSGTPTNLTIDDRYSAVIDIGFNFPFFGSNYSQLVASTNGLLSFDISKANTFSHYGILSSGGTLSATTGTPLDLPSALYDRALIMGPYHDLNPAYTTSPTQKIQYTTVGTAPHRKWILSFYKVPLFLTACNSLIENTHQIVLYESTGIIEVFVFSKQICTGWNQGRAMIGIQNYNRDQAVMVNGRKASDAPWGTIGMNESWRFVPSAGASLFKRVELYNLAGNLLTTGTTTNLNNGSLRASFSNVCPPQGVTSYVVKSVYQKIDDPSSEIFGLDTLRVTNNIVSSVTATANPSSTDCLNNNGSITVNASNGTAPYQYSLNGGTFQSGNTFTGLAQNTYTIVVRDVNNCTFTTQATVSLQNNLALTTTADTSICNGASFTPNTISNASGFSWSPTTGLSNPSIATPLISPLNTTMFTLTATLGACTSTKNLTVTVVPGASANAGSDAMIIAGDSYQIQATASAGTYLWTPSTGLSATNILNPVATPLVTTTYLLKVTSGQGCTATDDIIITVVPYCIKPMVAFTPNGDGINDKWLITEGTGCINKATAQVFNRYGAKVFESQDYKNTWDGNYNGKPLPDGTYYYVVTYKLINGKTVALKGNVTILR